MRRPLPPGEGAAHNAMRIQVKLFAMLTQWLPPGGADHTAELHVPEGATAHMVVDQLHIPPALATLAMVDGEHLNREEYEHRPLHEGETLAIFPPIAGGR